MRTSVNLFCAWSSSSHGCCAIVQPTESFLSNGLNETTSLLLDFDTPVVLKYCQVEVEEVQVRIFVISSDALDVGAAGQSELGRKQLASLHQTIISQCSRCKAGWTRTEVEGGLWTCKRCNQGQYVIDPNLHNCEPCAKGAICKEGSFAPANPAESVWNITSDGIYRILKCPPGFVLIRDEADPVSDRCVPCAPDTYSVEEAVFDERLWDRSVENYNQYCHPCPRSRAMCSGANDVRPLAGAFLIYFLSLERASLLSPPRHSSLQTTDLQTRARSSLFRLLVAPQQQA